MADLATKMTCEFGFKKEVYAEDDVSFLVDSMLSYWQGQDENAADKSGCGAIECSGGRAVEDKDIGIWVGERYYQRHDVHIVDTLLLGRKWYWCGC
ncbi:carbohydrate porin [Vibrio lentus]|nr:carbohydrate porin [Vibrio lentus]